MDAAAAACGAIRARWCLMWFRVEDDLCNHPKVLRAGNAAMGLWVRGGAYASKYRTNGWVPAEWARQNGRSSEISRLVEVELWTAHQDAGSGRVVGFQFHDWLDYNLSAEEWRQLREDAPRRGGLARARTAKRDALGHFTSDNGEPW